MSPRWRTSDPLAPDLGVLGGANTRQSAEPLPDLEEQLTAELSGSSWAVISFVPADAAWCDWIYRNLNGYPLPASLVDRPTPHGFPRPTCLSIFPDRRDPASESLTDRALETSAYLIVVCSPNSARSATVDEQIRTFKGAGGEERIVVLVVEGRPDARLGELPRAAQCDWLPSWLSWRLEEDGFRTADRTEPRVVDARPGYRSMKQVRDALLTMLADMDGGELERLGGFTRPVEMVAKASATTSLPMLSVPMAVVETEVAPAPATRGSNFTVWTAVVLIILAGFFGTRSFMEITAEEPISRLTTAHANTISPLARETPAEEESALPTPEPATTELSATVLPAAVPLPPAPAIAATEPPAPVQLPSAPPDAVRSNLPQIAPAGVFATSRVTPMQSASVVLPVATPVPVSVPVAFVQPPATTPQQDAVLLDEVRTLERRGDEIMAEKRVDDALDLYSTALDGAFEYAARKGSTAADKDHVVMLLRKLALLQDQLSSTAEARATYQQARRTLLQLKAKGPWTRDRAKALDELEARLTSLRRD